MSAIDARLPIASPNPMGNHRRQARAREERKAAVKAEATQPYAEPDLTGLCGARELLGSRVCDLRPHSRNVAHNGAGPKDARADFWGVR